MEAIKILHTADIHLGMTFNTYPDDIQKRLREARFTGLKNTVTFANEKGCDLFICTGDLFDKQTMSKTDIDRAAAILKEFYGSVWILPGNHDYYSGENDTWDRFRKECGDADITLMHEKRVYTTQAGDTDVFIFPAPCGARQSAHNGLEWIKNAVQASPDSGTLKIIAAHGSVDGLSLDPDGKYFPMTRKEIHSLGGDLILLGHTHSRCPDTVSANDRLFMAGTPEPDGFDHDREGNAWFIRIDETRAKADALSTGTFRFRHITQELQNDDQLQAFLKTYTDGDEKTLVKFTFTGQLPHESYQLLKESRGAFEEKFALIKEWDMTELRVALTADEINKEFANGSFFHRLFKKLSADSDGLAMQTAYDIIREIKK